MAAAFNRDNPIVPTSTMAMRLVKGRAAEIPRKPVSMIIDETNLNRCMQFS